MADTLSNHPNDYAEIEPTLDAIPAELGTPEAAVMDNGYFSEGNVTTCEERDIEPYIATGREPHHRSWKAYFGQLPALPPEDASPMVKMAYKLQTEIGQTIYRLQVHGGTGHWYHQRSLGLPPILVAWLGGGGRRVVFGMPGLQCEATACIASQ